MITLQERHLILTWPSASCRHRWWGPVVGEREGSLSRSRGGRSADSRIAFTPDRIGLSVRCPTFPSFSGAGIHADAECPHMLVPSAACASSPWSLALSPERGKEGTADRQRAKRVAERACVWSSLPDAPPLSEPPTEATATTGTDAFTHRPLFQKGEREREREREKGSSARPAGPLLAAAAAAALRWGRCFNGGRSGGGDSSRGCSSSS